MDIIQYGSLFQQLKITKQGSRTGGTVAAKLILAELLNYSILVFQCPAGRFGKAGKKPCQLQQHVFIIPVHTDKTCIRKAERHILYQMLLSLFFQCDVVQLQHIIHPFSLGIPYLRENVKCLPIL